MFMDFKPMQSVWDDCVKFPEFFLYKTMYSQIWLMLTNKSQISVNCLYTLYKYTFFFKEEILKFLDFFYSSHCTICKFLRINFYRFICNQAIYSAFLGIVIQDPEECLVSFNHVTYIIADSYCSCIW